MLNTRLGTELGKLLSEGRWLDKEGLGIIAGRQCWVVFVDAMVLGNDGNLLGAISLATKAALLTAVVPRLRVVQGDAANELEIQVSDDPYDAEPLPMLGDIPIFITLSKVGKCFIIDSTAEEEQCMAARLSAAVDKDGNMCGVQKSGPGGVSPRYYCSAGSVYTHAYHNLSVCVCFDCV